MERTDLMAKTETKTETKTWAIPECRYCGALLFPDERPYGVCDLCHEDEDERQSVDADWRYYNGRNP